VPDKLVKSTHNKNGIIIVLDKCQATQHKLFIKEKKPMKIAIIAAMEKETALLQKFCAPNILVAQSGIGKVAAALKTAEIITAYHPDLIINSGVAGGLCEDMQIGSVVYGKHVCYHDVDCGAPSVRGQVQGFPPFYESSSAFDYALKENVRSGLIISGDQFISTPQQTQQLQQLFPQAIAVDMESAAIAQTCHIYNVPFMILRLISDTPGANHHRAQYEAFWQTAAEVSAKNLENILLAIMRKDAEKSAD